MVVKMMRWSPWPPAAAAMRKFQVKVTSMRLEGFDHEDEGRQKVMGIQMRWKGGPKVGLVPFNRTSRRRKDISSERILKKGETVEWDDEFENACCFSLVSIDDKFAPWDAVFSLSYGESKGKMAVIGKVSVNIAEMASNMESQVERKLPINLTLAGVAREATLLISVSFVEIRDSQDSPGLVLNSPELMEKKKQKNQEEVSLGDSDESLTFDSEGTSETSSVTESRLSTSLETQLDPIKKVGFFSWKRRRLSSKSVRTKGEPLIKMTSENNDWNKIDADPQFAASSCDSAQKVDATELSESECQDKRSTTGNWEARELISRDGQTKLKANVFFASFDQRSNKAAGESACTALVAVIAHWLQSNQHTMPTRTEFDSLIVDGSSEWRKLCDNVAYVNNFPDKHFDLETVLRAGLRPIAISLEKSFVGFFDPEKFESLKGTMSFDEIWKEISSNADENHQRIYIVSWNDHFFVLKAEVDAYYMIDTLGERLFEGCNEAYILRFDNSALMQGKTEKEKVGAEKMAGPETSNHKEEREEIICSGKECCREFIKRFLAAIPLRELELEEKKQAVSYYSLHQRLQIEFNFSSSWLSSSSEFSSSDTASASSLFSNEECL